MKAVLYRRISLSCALSFHFPEYLLSGVSIPELESEHSERGDSGKLSRDFSNFPVPSSDIFFRLSSVPEESLRLWLGEEECDN